MSTHQRQDYDRIVPPFQSAFPAFESAVPMLNYQWQPEHEFFPVSIIQNQIEEFTLPLL